ncbi:MAG TPA: hypothetical protein VMS74_12945 [Acidimicrobiia bacterium]|nr:hypothetical protein [Acidimicrobiia bacterium]
MSKTDDERLGLGWEVWFLVSMLGAGGLAAFVLLNVMGLAFDPVASNSILAPARAVPSPGLDLGRFILGCSGAIACAAFVISLIRSTDWHPAP